MSDLKQAARDASERTTRLPAEDAKALRDAIVIGAPAGELLPVDSLARKGIPFVTGLIDYFPAALAYVALVSKVGNDKHNPGQALHWSRGKSNDHADALGRHIAERGGVDAGTGLLHSGEMAWRALALLQMELEEKGMAPVARGAR